MSNQYNNKVVLANGTTLIDLTGDDVTAADVAQGKIFHLPTGEQATGTASGGGGGSSGGLSNLVDISDSNLTMPFMLSQIKNGNTVGGTVTYSSNFTKTESLFLSTGLTTLHGLLMVGTTFDNITSLGTGASNKWFLMNIYKNANDETMYFIYGFPQNNVAGPARIGRTFGTTYNETPEDGTIRISGGDLYYSSRYNSNNNYQLVRSGVQYEWLAW